MKRITAILLAFYFAIAAIGIRYDMHYCMGNPVGIEVMEADCCGVQAELDDCCEDETVTYKIEDSFLASSNSIEINIEVIDAPKVHTSILKVDPQSTNKVNINSINAPPYAGPPLTELYCTYLI